MAGKKHKHRHRQQQQGKPDGLLDELSSLRDLLGTDDLGDIPLLDQVAEPPKSYSPRQAHTAVTTRQPVQEPLDESELPILFSPVDEELPEEISPELNDADRALLRPLQDLPASPDTRKAVTVEHTPRQQQAEQQTDLFDPPAPKPAENPFLPAHIRARLTGGRVPRDPEPAGALTEPSHQQLEPTAEARANPATEQEEEAAVAEALRELEEQVAGSQVAESRPAAESAESRVEDTAPDDRKQDPQRQKLVDRLVASQLPELERQLRARIELMLDELEARR